MKAFRLSLFWKPLLIGLILFPFALLGMLSWSRAWVFPDLFATEWTTQYWRQFLISGDELTYSFGQSLLISLSVATVATLSGFLTSKYLARHPWRRLWLFLAYFPYVLSPIIYAACIYFYFIRWGLSGNGGGVMLAQLIITYPYAVILSINHWNLELKAMEDLVATLGGNRWQAYQKVIFPLSKGMLLLIFFQTFIISWFEYGLTNLIGVGKIQTLTIRVFQYINEANPFLAALSSCLLMIPPLILLWINKRFIFKP